MLAGRRAIALVISALFIMTAGCGAKHPAPSAAQAGRLLQAHISALMTKIAATDIRVNASGTGDIACGRGRVEHTYAVTASAATANADADPEDLVDQMLGAVNTDAAYSIVDPMVAGSYQVTLRDPQSRTNLTLGSPGNGLVTAGGRTDCLKPS